MDELKHYGTLRRSGRYPWGSGENPYQGYKNFLSRVDELKKKGFTPTEIAKDMGMKTQTLRAKISIATDEISKSDVNQILRLRAKGYSNVAIGKRVGSSEETIRGKLKASSMERAKVTGLIANKIMAAVEKHTYVEIGVGVAQNLGISPDKLLTAVFFLKEKGYKVYTTKTPQLGTGKMTTIKAIVKDGTTYPDFLKNKHKIGMIEERSEDGGYTFHPPEPPRSVDSDRIKVRFQEEGGVNKDGVIEIRRGIPELNLGEAKYAQVRIAVDGSRYLKGMAVYGDDMPPGIDIIYNSNKKAEKVDKLGAMKKLKEDHPINQFGSAIRTDEKLSLIQAHYTDAEGKEQLSALNVVNEEGNWGVWSKTISSQVLSKQSPSLAKRQLKEAYDMKKEEFDEIVSLTNPSVKKKLLDSFADDCDSSAVHLKAASLPRQQSQVILPFPDMNEKEIYAPNFRPGERVVLIRYPHGGTFEIPELTVNNKHPGAKALIGQAQDAIGINPKVAERLSGADFDGDTVLVIPNNTGEIKITSPLVGLIGFEPREQYKLPKGSPVMTEKMKQQKMGDISNLITDMTIKGSSKGASTEEICKAVKHSMVVIDAVNHELDYKQSYIDNGIAALKQKYQGKSNAGASTLLSRASSEERVYEKEPGKWVYDPELGRKKRVYVDPATGKKLYEETGGTYPKNFIKVPKHVDPETGKTVRAKQAQVYTISKTGRQFYKLNGSIVYLEEKTPLIEKTVARTTKSTKMAETEDAFSLSSGTLMESLYAEHANKLKALGNQARKESIKTDLWPVSVSAKESYAKERLSLMDQLKTAFMNKPYERRAQLLANNWLALIKADNPGMDEADFKKQKGRALVRARDTVGAKKDPIVITDSEWKAIQSGAINKSILKQILDNTNMDSVKQRAMPRTTKGMTSAKIARARSMLARGETQADVADMLGVSITTLLTSIE